jgi:SAM-dependent methyltransferase
MAHALPLPLADPAIDQLSKTADARLYPSLSDPNFLVLRSRRVIFSKWIAQLSGSDLRVLDIGGRYQPYRPLFGARASRYVASDIVPTRCVNVVGDGEYLPFSDNAFDVVIATQVFEYFLDPRNAAREIHRVVKPGGCLLMSVAATAPRFVDEELWRFTAHGLRAILSDFSEVKVLAETSSIGGVIRILNMALRSFLRPRFLQVVIAGTVLPLLNLAALACESLGITDNDQFAPNYSVLAVRGPAHDAA